MYSILWVAKNESMDPTFPLIPVANFLAFLLILLSLNESMFRSWNIGVLSYAFWAAVPSFTIAVNTIIWSDNVKDVAPTWCDIVTHIQMASSTAISACPLVITRRLYMITRLKEIRPGATEKHKRLYELSFDLMFCVGLPIIAMILYYVGQASRYQILEELGCSDAIFQSTLGILLLGTLPILFPAISLFYYSPRIIWTLYMCRKEMDQFLASSPTIDKEGFLRALSLSCLDILVTLPIAIIQLVVDFQINTISFWPGWAVVHAGFASIPTATATQWESLGFWVHFNIKWTSAICPLLSLVFFSIFGFTKQSRAKYRKVSLPIVRLFRRRSHFRPELSDIAFETPGLNRTVAQASSDHTLDVESFSTSSHVARGMEYIPGQTKTIDLEASLGEGNEKYQGNNVV